MCRGSRKRDEFLIDTLRKQSKGWLLVAPAAILFLTFTVIPVFQGMLLSLYDAGIRHREFVGLKNFRYMFESDSYRNALRNTLGYAFVCVPIAVFIPFVVAVVAARLREAGQRFLRFAYYLPHLASGVVMAVLWRWIFAVEGGLLNFLISLIGINPVIWLGTNPAAFWAVVIVQLMGGMGMNVLIYMAAIASLDRDLYEAAALDGATELQQTVLITMPLLLPITGFLLIIRTIGVFQLWNIVLVLTRGGPAFGTTTLVLSIYLHAFEDGKFGLASAEAVVLLGIVAILSAAQLILVRRRK